MSRPLCNLVAGLELQRRESWARVTPIFTDNQEKFENRPLGPTNYLNPIIELASFRFLQIPHLESTWVD